MKKTLLFFVGLIACISMQAQILYEANFSSGTEGWVPNKGEWAVQDNPTIPDQPNQYGILEGAGINGDGGVPLSEENKPYYTLYDAESFTNYKVSAVLYPKWGNLFGLVFNYEDADNFWVLEIAARDKDAWVKQVKDGDFVGTYKWMPHGDDLSTYAKEYADTIKSSLWVENDVNPTANYWFIELITNEWDETTISVNGHVIFDKIDAGAGGKVGIWQNWCPVFARSFKVEDYGTESYIANFAEGTEGWTPNKGAWAVQDNPTIPDQPNQYGIIEGAGINGDGGVPLSEENKPIFTLYDAESYSNYRITAVLYPKWGNLFGLVFNYEDADNYWVLEIAARDKDAWIKQVKDGDFVGTYKWMPHGEDISTYAKEYTDTILNAFWVENDVDEDINYWTIDLVCNEYFETTITVNGNVIFDIIDAGTEGKVGIWQNWCPVFAKSFEVRQLGEGGGTNVDEIYKSGRLDIYPNPVNGNSFTIKSPLNSNNTNLSIFDITGKLVYSRQNLLPGANQINLDEFNALKGVYILHIQEGSSIHTGKLIVQ